MLGRTASLALFGLALGAPAAAGAQSLETMLHARFDGDDALAGMRLVKLELGETRAVLGLSLPARVRLDALPPEVENAFEAAVGLLAAERPAIAEIDLLVAHPGQRLMPPPRPSAVKHAPPPRAFVTQDLGRFPDGQALRGKVIAISPGHGWIWYDSLNDYGTQRGRVSWDGCGDCRGIVEDFETHEIAVGYLIPLLEGAGARVVLVRERDTTSAGLVVDDGEAAYSERGGTFLAETHAESENGRERTSTSSGATAEWSLVAPSSGPVLLTTWFLADPALSARSRLELEGPMGILGFDLDQRSHGRRWSPISTIDLDQGQTVKARIINLDGHKVVYDAMRIGSGKHSSGHPWWEMGCDPFTDYQRAPADITANGDVTSRPLYAEFYGADLYLAIHSNAAGTPGGTAMGTASYRYNCGTFPDHSDAPPAADCDDPPGSARLQTLVHASYVDAIKTRWDPNWRDRGPKVANFGEVRALSGIPGMLMEGAFHDNTTLPSGSTARMTENQALHDPRWRRAAAYGFYRGLSQFLVGDGPLVLDPPDAIAVDRVAHDRVRVRFSPVDGAARYRVYVAKNGRSFDAGTLSSGPSFELGGLSPGTIVSVQIASLNAAGEGLRSRVITARAGPRPSQILVVDAFDREDAWVEARDNRHNTAMIHGLALAGVEHGFDGASEAALSSGLHGLSGYEGLVLALGRESTEHKVLSPALLTAISAWVAGGGAVFADGSEIGWALDARGDQTSRAWLADIFGVHLGADDAGSHGFSPVPGGLYAASTAHFVLDDGTHGALESKYPDAFALEAGASAVLTYTNTTSVAAAKKGKNLVLGAALDSLIEPADRAVILGGWAAQIPLAMAQPDADAGTEVDAGPEPIDASAPADAGSLPAPDASAGAVDASDAAVAGDDAKGGGGCGCGASGTPDIALSLLLAGLLWSRRRHSS